MAEDLFKGPGEMSLFVACSKWRSIGADEDNELSCQVFSYLGRQKTQWFRVSALESDWPSSSPGFTTISYIILSNKETLFILILTTGIIILLIMLFLGLNDKTLGKVTGA